jgi:hypothetical protein
MEPPQTPEYDKLKACRPEIDAIEAFLDYLYKNDYAVCEVGGDYYIDKAFVEPLIRKSLGIDLIKVADEFDALLEYQRHLNAKAGI